MATPLYLFTGPEIGIKNEQVETIKSSLVKKFGEIEQFLLYASDSKIEDIVAKLRSDSLFVPATCIVLREAELIKKKEDIALISSWAESNRTNSVLILVSDEISIDSKLDKLVPKENKKIFWEMDENRLGDWIRTFFRKNGYKIEHDAVGAILELTESNTEALKAECERFFLCFPKTHEISADDVEHILAHNREESAFSLFDAMADSASAPVRLSNALSILQKILLTKGNSPIMITAGLASCFRRLELWHSIHSGGSYSDDNILRANGFSSRASKNQYSRASRVWTFGQCAAALASIAEIDTELRMGGQTIHETLLYLLVYELVMKNGSSCSKYESS